MDLLPLGLYGHPGLAAAEPVMVAPGHEVGPAMGEPLVRAAT